MPTETRGQPDGTDQARGLLDKAIIADQTQFPIFNVRDAVERVHQKTIGSFIERQCHGVGRKVAAAQVFRDAGRLIVRLARLGIGHRHGGGDLDPDSAGKLKKECLGRDMLPHKHRSRRLEICAQRGDITLHRDIQIADGTAACQIPDRSTREKEGQVAGADGVTDETQSLLLSGGKTIFQQVDIIGHSDVQALQAGAPAGATFVLSDSV